jgi:MFS family permease
MSPIVRAVNKTFSSLHIRNFRLFLVGQLISMTGTWMQTVALGWLVLTMTNSGVAVGVTLALQFGPILLGGLWGGLLADRFDKRRILIRTQSAAGIVATALFAISISEIATLPMIFFLTFLLGCVTAIDNPARQSFVTEMVGPDHVTNAVSLNSAVFNASRIIGPAFAAVVIATIGLPWAFLFNGLSFAGVIAAMFLMDPSALHREPPVQRGRGQLRAGLRYVWVKPELRYTVLLVAVVATLGLNFSVVLPLMARFVFDKGAETFGVLTSAMAAGALTGALVSAARTRPTRRLLLGSAAAFGALTISAAAAPTLSVLTLLLPFVGAASITFIATANATLQLNSGSAMRGRVMALHGLVFLGSTPLGGPLIGWISEEFGARAGLAVGGAATLVAAVGLAALLRRGKVHASTA